MEDYEMLREDSWDRCREWWHNYDESFEEDMEEEE